MLENPATTFFVIPPLPRPLSTREGSAVALLRARYKAIQKLNRKNKMKIRKDKVWFIFPRLIFPKATKNVRLWQVF